MVPKINPSKNSDTKIEGRSFANTLLNKGNEQSERPIYFTRREGGIQYGGKAYHAIRLGDWKLLQNSPFLPYELYNLKNDAGERNNLAEQNPEVLKKLMAKLESVKNY